MSIRSEMLMAAMIGALISAQQYADQLKAESGIDYGLIFDPERFRPAPDTAPIEAPVWDASGCSQPMGEYGLVMLQDVELARPRIAAVSQKAADEMPRLFACLPALPKLDPGSDAWWIQQTEISWATFGAFGVNPGEAFGVNLYERIPGDPATTLPSERLKVKYQEHVPGAMAMPRELSTAKACAARVLEYTRLKMENARIPETDAIDFSPARPRIVRG